MLLNQVPKLEGARFKGRQALENLIQRHIYQSILGGLEFLKVMQLLVQAFLGILNFDGLNLEPGLHLEKALIHDGFVLVTYHIGLIEEAYLKGISDERATLMVSALLAQLLLLHLLKGHL